MKLTPGWTWTWVDTDPPMAGSARAWRTLAFRYKRGRAITRINDIVFDGLQGAKRDLVWVDKGVFLRPATVRHLRDTAEKLVHFTPDTAFHENRSRYFDRTAALYDLLVTTKSFEAEAYARLSSKVHVTTQGFDADVHFPRAENRERRRETVFVGLAEADRERCLATLLEHDVPVRLAGFGWGRFLRRWGDNPLLSFEGDQIFGSEYADLLSRSWIGLGLLSRRFPELHTTRTFEIPACGAVLATEATADTRRFFGNHEALFHDGYDDLARKLRSMLEDDSLESLKATSEAGRRRVIADGRDYSSILGEVLARVWPVSRRA